MTKFSTNTIKGRNIFIQDDNFVLKLLFPTKKKFKNLL